MTKVVIGAVHAAEVEGFFRRLGLHDALLKGEIHCEVCGEEISVPTFKSALRVGGKVIFFCDRPSCEPDELGSVQPGRED